MDNKPPDGQDVSMNDRDEAPALPQSSAADVVARIRRQQAAMQGAAGGLLGEIDRIDRSYPPEWGEVVEEYRVKAEELDVEGVELDTLKLRGIVQFTGADAPQQRGRLDPDAPAASWPTRTPDLADRLRTHPDDEEAARELRRRGYHLSDGELKETPDGPRRPGARKLLRNRIVEELVLYLRPKYQTAWPGGETTPMRFVRQVHQLLLPYFPTVTPNKVKSTIDNLDR